LILDVSARDMNSRRAIPSGVPRRSSQNLQATERKIDFFGGARRPFDQASVEQGSAHFAIMEGGITPCSGGSRRWLRAGARVKSAKRRASVAEQSWRCTTCDNAVIGAKYSAALEPSGSYSRIVMLDHARTGKAISARARRSAIASIA